MIELVVIIGLFFTLLPLLIYYNKRNTNRSIKDIWNKSDRGLVVHDNVSLFSNVEDWLFEKGYSNIESEDEFNSVSQELSKIAIFSNYDEQIEIKLISCINKNVFFGIVNVDYSFKSGYANDRFSEYQFIGIVRN